MPDDDIDRFRNQLRALHRRLRREQPSIEGLTAAAYEVLIAIDAAGEPRQPSQIGQELQMTSPNVAAALRSLEGLSLVIRHKDAHDRRRVYVEISEIGREVISNARHGWRAWFRDAIDHHLTESEKQLLFTSGYLLQRLADDADFGYITPTSPGAPRPPVISRR